MSRLAAWPVSVPLVGLEAYGVVTLALFVFTAWGARPPAARSVPTSRVGSPS